MSASSPTSHPRPKGLTTWLRILVLASTIATTGLQAQPQPPRPPSPPTPPVPTMGHAAQETRTVPFLGVASEPIGPGTASQLGIEPGQGTIVTLVVEGSGADKGGLQRFDILLRFDGEAIHPRRFTDLIRSRKPGDTVEIAYLRKGEHRTAEVTLGERRVRSNSSRWSSWDSEEYRDAWEHWGEAYEEEWEEWAEEMEEWEEDMEEWVDEHAGQQQSSEWNRRVHEHMRQAREAAREAQRAIREQARAEADRRLEMLLRTLDKDPAEAPSAAEASSASDGTVTQTDEATIRISRNGRETVVPKDQMTLVLRDDEGEVRLNRANGEKRLRVADDQGNVLFEGVVDETTRPRLSDYVLGRLAKVEEALQHPPEQPPVIEEPPTPRNPEG